MMWFVTHRADRRAASIADRHYSRITHGSPQFTPPGRVLILVTFGYDALWCTSWPYAEYVNRIYPCAWVNSLFRNESGYLSSAIIRQAVAATRWKFGDPPDEGMITLINTAKVRHKRDPGRCFLRAGFQRAGWTRGGLLILRLSPGDMPAATMPSGVQMELSL